MKKDKKDKKEKKEKRFSPSPPKEKTPEDPAQENPIPSADPLEYALSLIGGKWKLRILWALGQTFAQSSYRYGDLKAQIPGITDMMFSQSLKELTASGFIVRTQFQEIPPRVEYALTENGKTLLPVIGGLESWAIKQLSKEK